VSACRQLSLFSGPRPGSSDGSSSLTLTPHAPGRGAAPTTPSASVRALRPAAAPREARLPAPDDIGAHQRAMAAVLRVYLPPGKGLDLHLTNNHYSMISVRRKPEGYRLHLHRMFVGAEPRVLRALGRYVVHNDKRASRLLGDYIERHQHIIRKQVRKPRQINLRTAGHQHDLRAIFDRLNGERFDGKLDARITWGPIASQRARRSIKMGSFAVEDRIIRIHPVLDKADVPEFFVAWIVFHEMLHGKHDIVRDGHRRIFHSQAFLEEERTYPDYERASAWERANLDRLLGG
jgi:predicted metal-dependent hydrolase